MWIDHDDPNLENRMQQAIGAIAQRRFADGETQLNDLVAAAPDWAETWNKRATLYYLTHRDAESVADIRRTLELEPRHFGAICGFGQICLRRSEEHTSELQSLMRISYAVFCLKKKNTQK